MFSVFLLFECQYLPLFCTKKYLKQKYRVSVCLQQNRQSAQIENPNEKRCIIIKARIHSRCRVRCCINPHPKPSSTPLSFETLASNACSHVLMMTDLLKGAVTFPIIYEQYKPSLSSRLIIISEWWIQGIFVSFWCELRQYRFAGSKKFEFMRWGRGWETK